MLGGLLVLTAAERLAVDGVNGRSSGLTATETLGWDDIDGSVPRIHSTYRGQRSVTSLGTPPVDFIVQEPYADPPVRSAEGLHDFYSRQITTKSMD